MGITLKKGFFVLKEIFVRRNAVQYSRSLKKSTIKLPENIKGFRRNKRINNIGRSCG
jgi:hypothetical protein